MSTPLAAVLHAHGIERTAAAALAAQFAAVSAALRARGVDPAGGEALFVPGRIEALGKHTDYAGGRSLLCAVDRGFCLVAVPRADQVIRLVDAGWGEEREFPLDPALDPLAGDWANYPMTAARRLARNFPEARRGVTIGFSSTLPPASGLSSSSALLTAVFLSLARVNELDKADTWRRLLVSREDLAEYLGTVENGQSFRDLPGDRGVGTFGGSEDHTAILCCRPDAFSMYGFCPVRREREVAMPGGHVLLVAASGVAAEKTGAARSRYNQAAQDVTTILDLWRQATGRTDASLAAAVGSSADASDMIRKLLRTRPGSPDDETCGRLLGRFNQFCDESERIVPAAAEALASGELETFGTLVDRSQAQAERLLRNQVPETVFLARTARDLGAVAASAFGAGFGGSVWAMVAAPAAAAFESEWAARYRAAFPLRAGARFFGTMPGPAAFWLAQGCRAVRPDGLISPARWS